jgi:quercetin dioxygenase-like cupin family protein
VGDGCTLTHRGEIMPGPVKVSRLESRSMDEPDERRSPEKTTVDVVNLEGFTLGRITLQPGWRWSECIKPVVGTESCQVAHVGYVISGRITVRQNDGSEVTLGTGSAYAIPPGHDAWVEGDEPMVGLEVLSAGEYAKA